MSRVCVYIHLYGKCIIQCSCSHMNICTHYLHTLTPSHPPTLTQILVECGTTGGKWLFPCQRWLCLDTGDGRIERELHPTVEEKEGGGGERRWRVHVWTSDIRGAGTDANVTLQVS